MKWNHIMDSQPDHNRSIIQCNPIEEDGYYQIGMRVYCQYCTFEELLSYNRDNYIPDPNFWWIYAEDFPFPLKK